MAINRSNTPLLVSAHPHISEQVNQDSPLARVIYSIFRCALRPFITAYSALSNKWHTGHYLTTTQVLSKDIDYRIEANGGAEYNISTFTQRVKELKSNSYVSFHIGCQAWISHSTMLIIGKNSDGNYYALFFDAQGKAPKKSVLMQKEFILENRETIQLNTVEDLYHKITETIKKAPPLLYSSSYIQADWVSCTAYSAVFFEAFKEAVNGKEKFNEKSLIKQVANQRLTTFRKAREIASKLSAPSSQTDDLKQAEGFDEFVIIQ